MKKEKAFKQRSQFISGSFTDYRNEEREFIIASVAGEDIFNGYAVQFGISVRNIGDTYNEELGKTIAEGKALKKPVLVYYTEDRFLVKKSIIRAMLEDIAADFKTSPEKYLPNYNKIVERHKTEVIEKANAAKAMLRPSVKTTLE